MTCSRSAAIVFLVLASCLVAALSHDEAGEVKFSYNGTTGPEHWGSLSPKFKLCTEGKKQSPINIVTDKAVHNPHLDHLDRDYSPAKATLIHTTYDVLLKFDEDVGTVLVGGKNYSLKHIHWHAPSEHTIDGERFPMEMHLVHKSGDGSYAVVSVLYKYGKPDSFLFQLKNKFGALAKEKCGEDEEAHIRAGAVYTRGLRKRTRSYFRYSGSFTTPPCSENVVWNILGKVREMTKEQAALIMAALPHEHKYCARPVQPLNGRTVQLYDESSQN